MKFNTVEEAEAHIKTLNEQISSGKTQIGTLQGELKTANASNKTAEARIKVLETEASDFTTKLSEAVKLQEGAEEIAKDALARLNVLEESLPKKLKAKVSGKTYEVIFGVDGLTKEELAEDKEKLELLVKHGSSAIKLLED